MKKSLFVLLFILAVTFASSAQPTHFTFTSNTGESYSVVISNATLNGSNLANGDEIGVFTPASLCVGATVWTGTSPLALTAWKDDSQTASVVDGYQAGETMSFKIWDKSANQEFNATATYTMGNGTFGDGFAAQLSLTAGSGGTESITVVAPNGGEDWTVGTQHEIKWTSANFTGQVKIEYSIDGNASHLNVIPSTNDDGSYMWTVPNTPSTQCVVIISDASDGTPSDINDAMFTISSGGGSESITVVAPNGGEDWQVGTQHEIKWTSSNFTGSVHIEYSTNSGTSYSDIIATTNNVGSHIWTVPDMPSSNCRVKVSDAADGNPFDTSDNDFTISSGGGSESITVIAPNGGENLEVGSEFEIQWTSSNFTGQVSIEGSIDGGGSFFEIIGSTENDGSFIMPVPDTPSSNCRIKISDAADGDPFDVSDGDFTISAGPVGGDIIVTNTDDSGPGSLREAIIQANTNPDPDMIVFQIPKGVPGFDSDVGIWTIEPQSALPKITGEGLIINGFSQADYIGEDTNPNCPEIQIAGFGAGENSHGLHINTHYVEIFGISVHNFGGTGIYVEGAQEGRIGGCYIGVDFRGDAPAENGYGIILTKGTQFFHVVPADTMPNVISGNTNVGVMISDSSCHNVIAANIIGLNKTCNFPIGNGNHGGIMISDKSDSNEVMENVLCGNAFGMVISGSNANFIVNNHIGTYHDWEPLGNENDGIFIADNSQYNFILDNVIGHNGGNGIRILGTQTLYNTITHNFISQNSWAGINNSDGGNGDLAPPTITSASKSNIDGTTLPNATVEIFTDHGNQGMTFHEGITADGSGNFSWAGTIESPFNNITTTATDVNGNTSEFSEPVQTSLEKSPIVTKVKSFSLHQNYPNPFNPETTIRFDIPVNSQSLLKVNLCIYNLQGQLVRSLLDEEKPPGVYTVQWNGLDDSGEKVTTGVYLYSITAGDFKATKKMAILK